ncbi:Thioredoxin domain-containing protein plp1 [Pseudocercospora fuligena]|uniref:Thioredoxin domain-containing protein plp1 n=1 Tax=Pseudocercospora fuligena TaxID=685502 RepID=A0A8H6VN93_9PEZI|nr:Thioredoxin domain-containing protein plp1 [Pseudocercospora fuligena]
MAALDPHVAKILDSQRPGHESDDEDALIAELEEDEDSALSGFREQRLAQLHAEVTRAKLMKEGSHGSYTEIKDEKQLMDITTSTKLCVVHFMKPDFNRCRVMDEKLTTLAGKHFDTRFVTINVDNAPFLVVKLGIKVLPCVIAFKDGVSSDRIIGFEGIGWKPDSFTASELEARLLASGVLVRAKMTEEDDRMRARKQKEEAENEYDDDWD